jgi:hypothetical protein
MGKPSIVEVTAKSVKRALCAKKQSDLTRICVLAIFGLAISLAPVSARAQGVPKEIAELKAEVAALHSQVHALETELAGVRSNNALKLGAYVTVDPDPENGVRGPNITFKGANIHIVSGSGATDDNLSHGGSLTGLGNLIIGYDESPAVAPVPPPPPLNPGDRGGSHNLIIGRWNKFNRSAFGGLVAGELDIISNEGASITGGFGNTASGRWASVTSGQDNTASGQWGSVTGGSGNTASGFDASVSGGGGNHASGFENASVSGGLENTASGPGTSVTGGFNNTASGPQGSVVTGGAVNTASGLNCIVLGGQNVTASNTNSIAPQNLSLFP